MNNCKFSILITTKNRLPDLIFTLNRINVLLQHSDLHCIICDDGSSDGTSQYIKKIFPHIELFRNEQSQGLIYSRNKLLEKTKSQYAISIDDDLHFITTNVLEIICNHFDKMPTVGIFSFRIFWDKLEPQITLSDELAIRMQSYAGGAHAIRMKAWRDIPDYPSWFVFYGEEDFASYHLFKKGWEVHYLPEILVNHRVDLKARKNNTDYAIRLRRSLRSGWYLFFLFYPLKMIPRKMAYSIWMQLKLKVFKGDFKTLQALCLATVDLIYSIPKILKNCNRLTQEEYDEYQKLPETKIYWRPENES